jgi:carboxymethylenebutenolidase
VSADPKGLGALFDAHTDAEFKTRDIEATMATMNDAPHVTHVPTMTGGSGRDAVRRLYDTWFIGHWPEDTVVTPISRTVGDTQVVDEVMISPTHDCEMPALLPGGQADRPQGDDPLRGGGRVQGWENSVRAHLLGPSVAARADRFAG